jgi:hypothetical protein
MYLRMQELKSSESNSILSYGPLLLSPTLYVIRQIATN